MSFTTTVSPDRLPPEIAQLPYTWLTFAVGPRLEDWNKTHQQGLELVYVPIAEGEDYTNAWEKYYGTTSHTSSADASSSTDY